MIQVVILGAIFLGTAGVIVGGYLYFHRHDLAEADAVRTRLSGEKTPAEAQGILRDTAASDVAFLDRFLQGRGITSAMAWNLERAGSGQKPAVFLLTVALFGAVGIALGSRYGGLYLVVLPIVGVALPIVWLLNRQRRRIAAFDTQLPDALDMLSNSMKAGYSFQAATRFLSEEMDKPLGPEFGRFYDQQRLGVDVRTALLAMQQRIDSLNLKMFVTAVLIQRETGGNLTELLGNLGALMRDRVALQGHIETLTAEPKLSGRFLAILPVVVFFALTAANPTFMAPFSGSSIGHLLLGMATASVIIGYYVMMKIADVDA